MNEGGFEFFSAADNESTEQLRRKIIVVFLRLRQKHLLTIFVINEIVTFVDLILITTSSAGTCYYSPLREDSKSAAK